VQDQDAKRRNEGLQLLSRQTESSHDKLFFIFEPQLGMDKPRWYLVQVDLDETDPIAAK
jgi:hypothetical protein